MQRKWSQLKTQLNSSKKKASKNKNKNKIRKDQLAVGLLAQWLEPCTGNAKGLCSNPNKTHFWGDIFFRNSISWKNCFCSLLLLFVCFKQFVLCIYFRRIWSANSLTAEAHQVACWRKLVKHCKQIDIEIYEINHILNRWIKIWTGTWSSQLDEQPKQLKKNLNIGLISSYQWIERCIRSSQRPGFDSRSSPNFSGSFSAS